MILMSVMLRPGRCIVRLALPTIQEEMGGCPNQRLHRITLEYYTRLAHLYNLLMFVWLGLSPSLKDQQGRSISLHALPTSPRALNLVA